MPSRSFLVSVLACLLVKHSVNAHSYLIQPKNRLAFANGFGDSTADGSGNAAGLCHIGDGTATCCGAKQMSESQRTVFTRGTEVPTAWWRNNHAGGMIRYSVVPIADSDSQDAFDAAENVISYHCNQNGCDQTYNGESPNNWSGGDSAGSKGWSNACTGSWKIPYHLKDGIYTMQWVWFATGNAPSTNSPFQSCFDFEIKGGPTGSAPACPLWKGGDLSEKSKTACVYASVDQPTYQGVCKEANACTGSWQVGVPKAIEACSSGQKLTSYPLEMAVSKGFPDTYSSYAPSSSGNSSSSTSSSSSSSSGKNRSSSSSQSSSQDRSKSKAKTGPVKKCKAKNSKRSATRHRRRRSLAVVQS